MFPFKRGNIRKKKGEAMKVINSLNREKNVKYLLMLPVLVWIAIFTFYPLIYSLRLSFYKEKLSGLKFVGLANFIRAFSDPRFWNDLRVTIVLVIVTVTLEFFIGFGLALLLNRKMKGQKLFRFVFTIPLFACPVAVSYIGLILFSEENGIINTALMGLFNVNRIPWLSSPSLAIFTCILLNVWQWVSFTFLVLTAGLQSLPEEPQEAALVDGATRWQNFKYITIPMLKPVILTTFLFKLVYSLKVFDIPFNLTEGGPGLSSEVYSIFVFRTGLKYLDVGYASALSYLFLIVVLLICSNLISRMREIYSLEGE